MLLTYYKLSPELIFQDIIETANQQKIKIRGLDFLVDPHVYPSQKFRTTNFLLDSVRPLILNSNVCDMGCGFGVVGLYSLHHGANKVIQADINPLAIANAKANKKLQGYKNSQLKIYKSDCFDNIPQQKFDIIIFNIPFHSELFEIKNPLEYAFHDPLFVTVKKFLFQVSRYTHENSKIIIAFSSKGDIQTLEKIFSESHLKWKIWKKINTDQEFDNRLYLLRV